MGAGPSGRQTLPCIPDEKGADMDVICAVDGSSASAGVVRYAADVASRVGVTLRIVRAVQVADPLFVTSRVAKAIEDPVERRERVLEHTRRQLDALGAGVEGVASVAEVRQGAPDIAVLEAVHEHGAQLLVIGTRARKGARNPLGNVAQRIVRRAPCPVLVVPHGHDRNLSESPTILVGVRGGDREDAVAAVREAERVAQLLRAELVLVHSTREGRDASWFEELAASRPHVASHGAPAPELLRIANETGADAIAVAPRGHGPLRQALLGSVSNGLLSAGERPVFVIPRTHKDGT